jgi:hypothetical protein
MWKEITNSVHDGAIYHSFQVKKKQNLKVVKHFSLPDLCGLRVLSETSKPQLLVI